MTTIKTKCPTCGEVNMGPAGISLELPIDADHGIYAFTCPECRSEVSKPASRKTVALLLAAGVEPVDQEEAEAPVLPSADRSPDPGAPAFTLDDVIGFHFQLGDDAAIAYGLGIL
jgi:predicted RNA-binding Zn-ribbon protein involved in translation (DUF1610 family)